MRFSALLTGSTLAAGFSLLPSVANAATYQVGPTRAHTQLEQFEEFLSPGDVVELDGDATYSGDVWMEAAGTAAAPVVIRGITVNGKRPVISGGDYTLMLKGGYYVVENIEITGGAEVCLFQKAENLVFRDSVVHDCDKHGILGADWGTGSFLMQRDEVFHCGYDIYKHQVYVATDETDHPGSVFRMEGCYLHDANGGNNVKSRAERVELYGNWIEGAMFHELDLIGSQEHPVDMAREDSDVVGNVIVKAPGNGYTIARVGGDGTGDTHGRHRFVNNTMILSDETQYGFRLAGQLESFELHDNVIVGNGATQLWREEYAGTMTVSGTANWMSQGITTIDDRISAVRGTDPGFVSLAGRDFRPIAGSALVDTATPNPLAPSGMAVPNAQGVPAFTPGVPGGQGYAARILSGNLDIGAFELDSGSGGTSSSSSSSGTGGAGGSDTTSSGVGGAGGGDPATTGSGSGAGDASSSSGSSGETTGSSGETTGSGDTTSAGGETTGAGSSGEGGADAPSGGTGAGQPTTDSGAHGGGDVGTSDDGAGGSGGGDTGDDATPNSGSATGCSVGATSGAGVGQALLGLLGLGVVLARRRKS